MGVITPPWSRKALTLVRSSSTKEKNTKDEIVVEMKTEDSVLLKAANGDQKDPSQPTTVVSSKVTACSGFKGKVEGGGASLLNIFNIYSYVSAAGFFNE